MRTLRCVVVLTGLLCLGASMACQRAYYDAMEAVGIEKREILVDRSEELRDTLHRVRTEYSVALDRMASIVQPDALNAEQRYKQAEALYEDCEDRYDELTSYIAKTEDVANALFEDWITQSREQADAGLRNASQQRLEETRTAFRSMMRPVHSAADRVQPVLRSLEGHVQHLKLNMDETSADNVRNELDNSRLDVTALLEQSQAAIDAANTFINTMTRQMHQQRVGQ